MNIRRTSGSVTTFAVGCVILLVIIGVFASHFSLLLGGSSQLQQACDAGTLNLARTALVSPSVPLSNPTMLQTCPITGAPFPYQDFFACIGEMPGDNSKGVTLANINKVLAQALIVASNAEAEGTPAAINNGLAAVWAAGNLGTALRYQLCPNGLIPPGASAELIADYEGSWAPGQTMPPLGVNSSLESAFTSLAQGNIINMLHDSSSAIQFNNETVSWMDRGGSSSIWVDPNTVSPRTYASLTLNTSSPLKPTLSYVPQTPYTPSYIRGYQAIPLLNNTADIGFVVDRPLQTTNLASAADFDNGTSPLLGPLDAGGGLIGNQNLAWLPPNAFKVTCQAQDNSGARIATNPTLSTLACSVIGAIGNGSVACVPAGVIVLQNLPPATPVSSTVTSSTYTYDGTNDIFNNEMASPTNTVYINPLGGDPTQFLFDSSNANFRAWEKYLTSTGTDAMGHDPHKDPLGANVTPTFPRSAIPAVTFRIGTGLNQKASLANILTQAGLGSLTRLFPAEDVTVDGAEGALIDEAIQIAEQNYGRSGVEQALAGIINSSRGRTVVEELKAYLLLGRKTSVTVHVNLPGPTNGWSTWSSGSKYFKHFRENPSRPGDYSYAVHYAAYKESTTLQTAEFGVPGTPFQLISSINEVLSGPVPVTVGVITGTPGNHAFDPNNTQYLTFLNALTQRVKQIYPGFTSEDVVNALSTGTSNAAVVPATNPVLDVGDTLYLHATLNTTPPVLVVDRNVPYLPPGIQADGAALESCFTDFTTGWYLVSGGTGQNAGRYNAYINTWKDGTLTAKKSDDQFHKAMFKKSEQIQMSESAILVPSSGYNNLLGTVEFGTQLQNASPTVTTFNYTWPN